MKKGIIFLSLVFICFLMVLVYRIYEVRRPMISVVMSTYNRARMVQEALDSIQAQTYEDFEVIVINDGSTDDTATVLEQYARKDSRIRVLTNPQNKGLAFSLNRGLDAARGTYIARMDDDDLMLPQRLKKQLAYMEAHPEITAIGGLAWLNSEGSFFLSFSPRAEINKMATFIRVPMPHPTAFIRRAFLEEHGIRYRSIYESAEDTDFWNQITLKGGLISGLKEPILIYRTSSQKKNGYNAKQADSYGRSVQDAFARIGLKAPKALYVFTREQDCFYLGLMAEAGDISAAPFTHQEALSLYQEHCPMYQGKILRLSHPDWNGILRHKVGKVWCREESNCAEVVFETGNCLLVKWDKWGTETFCRPPDVSFYVLQSAS